MTAGVPVARTSGVVLFDFGGTLDAPGVTWRERVFRLCQAEGLVGARDRFDPIYFAVDDSLVGRVPETLSFRDTVVRLIAGVTEALGSRSEGAVDRLAARFVDDALLTLRGHVPLLRALSERYRLAIVSNFYGNLATVCRDAGIAEFFALIVDSARVGWTKPDLRIFRVALDALGVGAAGAVFVGDSLARDSATSGWPRPTRGAAGPAAPAIPSSLLPRS